MHAELLKALADARWANSGNTAAALESGEFDAEAADELAHACLARCEYTEALRLWHAVLAHARTDLDRAVTWLNIGNVFVAQGKLDEAKLVA